MPFMIHGAFDLGVGSVVSGGVVNPGGGLGAGTDGAIMGAPGGVGVLGTGVASALVVAAAGAVAAAAVGAVRRDCDEGDEGDDELEHGKLEYVRVICV
jgi:hypothetical protein